MTTRTHPLGRAALPAVLAALVSVACAAPASAPVTHDLTDEDLAAVRAVWDAIGEAQAALDWDGVESMLSPDFVHLDPRSTPIVGVDAWREWLVAMDFGAGESGYTVEEIAGSGDLAYMFWTFVGSWTEAGELMETSGKGLSLFARDADGVWRLIRNAWNANP
jgi:ketosteroid isomerase-like protein